MSDAMHGIEADVPFDFAAAEALSGSCEAAAGRIDEQSASRTTYALTALKDFRGHFSELFRTNAVTAGTDASELAGALRTTAAYARRLSEEARKEQQRRETARRWKQEQDDRSLWDKGVDKVFGGDEPPVGPPAEPIAQQVPAPQPGPRQTPRGGGGGGGGGTSSARPADLHAFATGSADLNTALVPLKTRAQGDYDHFVATCHWGSLAADGVFSGFTRWLTLNDDDVTWAKAVGDAFARAGSEGSVSTLPDPALGAALQAAGVSASRQDLTIAAPAAFGHPPTTGYADDPVNTATGNFVESEADLGFAGGAAEGVLTRSYNSVDPRTGAFGPGWSSWTGCGLEVDAEAARFTFPDGRVVTFPRLGDGWDRAAGENLWLTATDGGHVVNGNDGSRWELGAAGRLAAVSTGPGTRVSLRWADGRLVALDHERDRHLELVWDDDRVVAALASDGGRVDYAYDDQGRLTAVSGPLGTRRYGWDDAGLLATVTGADGTVEVDNTYDDRARVTSQRSPFGRTSRYVYLPGRVTSVSDADGSRANTWVADPRGRLVGVVDADGRRQSTAYDPHGNVVLVTERDGSVTVQEHDARGRLVRRVTPSGADLRWAYDDADRVVGVTTESGATTTLSYQDDERGPSLVVDPEGGRTRLTWRAGLLVSVTDPTGVEVGFTHDVHGDLVEVRAADGGRARFERDAGGRVTAIETALGARTELTYDAAGLLVGRRQPDGGEWRFEHTPAGLLVAVTDPTGARQEVEHVHGVPVRAVDALGRVTTTERDDLGLPSAVRLPDGSRWSFTHDALSRLTDVTDPAGAVWHRAYDAVGRLAEETDPTGVRRTLSADVAEGVLRSSDATAALGLRLDRLGRVVAGEGVDGSTTLTRYDRCGRPVEHVDAAGGVTTLTRDAAGRVVAITSPGGGTRTLAYDRCGRLASVVDELGAATTLEHDLEGRVTRMVLPDGTAVTTAYDAMGRVVRRHVPGHGTTTVERDALGRPVAVTDPRNGRRRFRHDAAGRVVEAMDANGGTTRYDYDDGDRLVAVTDPLGGRRTRTYDAAGRLVAETDPLGRTVRAGHDAAGRQTWQEDPTGTRIGWAYDEAGRLAAVSVDGQRRRSVERDFARRTVRVREDDAGTAVVHELVWDPRGLLVSRTRDGVGPRWRHDADGGLVARVEPDGTETTYGRDRAGRLVRVDHPLLGRAVLELDSAGHVRRASAGASVHEWTRDDGFVVEHRVVGDRVAEHDVRTTTTRVERDDQGRVLALRTDGAETAYAYDAAGQLVGARSGADVRTWRYDAAGRLVEEESGTDVVRRTYDAAGQLLRAASAGGETRYAYDAGGRRTRRQGPDGSEQYGWDAFGWLASVSRQEADGPTQVTALHVDALGELSRVGGDVVVADSADPWGGLLRVGSTPLVAAGPLTGVDGIWHSGWRPVRGTGADVWSVDTVADLPGGLRLGASGEVQVAGLEWMGARAYDPVSHGFLSTDPLDPVAGAGWAGNPYAYAGNDPLGALDPLGLSPVTDAELEAYTKAHQGWATPVTDWVSDNWEYLAAGAMVVGGVVMMATGVGGPIGMGLVSAGIDTGVQKFTTGKVNWGEVAVSGAVGMVGAGVTGVLGAAGKGGAAALRTSMAVNAGVGAGSSEAVYLATTDPSQWSLRDAAGAAAGGGLAGAVGGLAGPTGGTVAKQLGSSSTGVLAKVTTGAINFGGGFSGSVANDLVRGDQVDYTNAAISGGVNTGGGIVGDKLFPSKGTGTLDQHSTFGVRTVRGAFNVHGVNTQAMWGSAGSGAVIGGVADVINPF